MGLNLKHPPFLLMFSTNRGQTWWIVVAPCLESCLLDISRATWTISNPFPERWLHLGEVDNWSPLPEVEFKMYMFTIVYIIYINILYIKKYVIYIYMNWNIYKYIWWTSLSWLFCSYVRHVFIFRFLSAIFIIAYTCLYMLILVPYHQSHRLFEVRASLPHKAWGLVGHRAGGDAKNWLSDGCEA